MGQRLIPPGAAGTVLGVNVKVRKGEDQMNYKIEEVLPVVAKLADRYTSKECSSISCQAAEQLLEAAVYCINELDGGTQDSMLQGQKVTCMQSYEAGYQIVLEKVGRAKDVYHSIIEHFDDYGCKNYRDTILSGIPAFFTWYDPRFAPQNHILTLDYPVPGMDCHEKGVDLILYYLEEIAYEQNFLHCFHRHGIINLLESICPDYEELYLDNVCQAVLLRSLACMVTESPLFELKLEGEGRNETGAYFADMALESVEMHVSRMLDFLEKTAMKEAYKGRFQSSTHDLAVRITNHVLF